MISVTEALSIVSNITYTSKKTTVLLKDADGLVLSDDVVSPINMPPFRQSAMDGYALSLHHHNSYEVIGEVPAGSGIDYSLSPGQGVRIFTGARVPDDAETVIMQEKVHRSENHISIKDQVLSNTNIRPTGEQIKEGEVALKKGTQLTPAGIGYLAGLGITEVQVFNPPSVAIITTGNELITPGLPLKDGQIYESNSVQLEVALKRLNVKKIQNYTVQDDYDSTRNTVKEAITNHEIVLISGGISVGDYDFVKDVLAELQIDELFYKIKQKPGKPLFFGRNSDTLVFALPGNPASSLTCFYIYVLPTIRKIMGLTSKSLKRATKAITTDFSKKGDRAQFLKAKVSGKTVEILEGQSSAMLLTYAIANALVYIPENMNTISKGDLVETIILPK